MLSRRQFVSTASAASLAAALPAQPAPAAQAARRPNVIIMMADDMGFSDLGCYGSEIRTPNIDALAKDGLRFTQFYNTARCCPTRASLLTGLYPHQAGIGHMMEDRKFPAYRGDLSSNAVTIAEVMRSGGYHTWMTGKWHVTPVTDSKHNWPRQRGFDKFYGTIHGAGSFYDPSTLSRDNDFIEPEGKDFYYTNAIGANASRYIEEAATAAKPFFGYVAFTSPHWPMHALEADIDRYKTRYRDGWDALREERHRRMVELGLVDKRWPLTPRDPDVPAWKDAPNKEWEMRRMAVYAAMIDCMDQNVGRIVAALKKTGQLDNTLLLMLADNGGCAEVLGPQASGRSIPEKTRDGRPVRRGNIPTIMPGRDDDYQSYGIGWANSSNTPFRRYKHWVHEGGISSPLIAHWPGVIQNKGGLTPQPGHLIDLMATAADAGNAKYPGKFNGKDITPLEGKSLRPILEGKQRKGHSEIFWEHEGNRAVRQGKWKVVSRHPGAWELYDMEADRTEMNDLTATQPAKAAELAAKWESWSKKVGVVDWDVVRKS
ncbi:MAG: arylsulfatase [Bryobacterales bacterium]|nr:arylsulfatase [Bryobacterales bacterium]